jgi:ubiquinone/menaquinone biosynthesis C-methylase UbiE
LLNSKWDNQPEKYAALRDCWLNQRRELHLRGFLAQARPGQVVLEIGSGTGGLLLSLSRQFPDLEFHGVEPQGAYVEYARRVALHPEDRKLSFHIGYAEALPSRLPQADYILTNDVIHHWSDPLRAVKEITRASKPGARWKAIEPNSFNPYVFMGQSLKQGERNFRPAVFLSELRKSGWLLQKKEYLFLIPPFWKNPPLVAKKLEQALEGFAPLAGGISLDSELKA